MDATASPVENATPPLLRRKYAKLGAIGGLVLAAVLVVAVLAAVLIREWHAANWMPVQAEIAWAGELCELQIEVLDDEDRADWMTRDVVACHMSEAALAERTAAVGGKWRSHPAEYAEIVYETPEGTKDLTFPRGLVSAEPVSEGQSIAIFFDPEDPDSVDRANTSEDYMVMVYAGLGGLGIALGLAALGWVFGWTRDTYYGGREPEPSGDAGD